MDVKMVQQKSTSEQTVVESTHSQLGKPFVPFRYFVMFMIVFCTSIGYAVRSTINVALLAMVDDSTNASVTSIDDHLDPIKSSNKQTFNWSQYDQALILGGYFYTFTGSLLISGVITDKSKTVLLLSITQTLAAILSLLTPLAATTSVYCLIGARMFIGLVHGAMLPCCYKLIEHWFPPEEVALAQSLMNVGCNFGTAISMPVTAWLCESQLWGGWPSAFITFGIANLIFVAIFYIGVSDDPELSPWLSQWEKTYLSRVVVNRPSKSKQIKTPWLKLFTSLPLWSVFWVRGLIGLAYYTVNTKIPVYLEKVLDYKITSNGLINSSFYIVVCAGQLIAGPLSKAIIIKGWLPRTLTRKVFETIACLGLGSGLLIISYLGERSTLVVITLLVSMFLYGFDTGGNIPIVPEMAPKFVGTAFGFSNTLISASGFIAPALIGLILGNDTGSSSNWNLTFHIIAGLQVVGILIFITFASAEPQSWAMIDDNNGDNDNVEVANTGTNEKDTSRSAA